MRKAQRSLRWYPLSLLLRPHLLPVPLLHLRPSQLPGQSRFLRTRSHTRSPNLCHKAMRRAIAMYNARTVSLTFCLASFLEFSACTIFMPVTLGAPLLNCSSAFARCSSGHSSVQSGPSLKSARLLRMQLVYRSNKGAS